MVATAIIAAVSAVLAQHLGLSEAIAGVVLKIAKCPMCCAMWLTFAALLYTGADLIAAVSLSILMSYLSNWFIMLLIILQDIYTWLRKKIEKQSSRMR